MAKGLFLREYRILLLQYATDYRLLTSLVMLNYVTRQIIFFLSISEQDSGKKWDSYEQYSKNSSNLLVNKYQIYSGENAEKPRYKSCYFIDTL